MVETSYQFSRGCAGGRLPKVDVEVLVMVRARFEMYFLI